tara:strand:- start:7099 stop:8424 length:1326 start_codon:yes stop_codon:yes gene_type:complete
VSNSSITENLDWMDQYIQSSSSLEKKGTVTRVTGLVIESEGPEAALGDIVKIHSPKKDWNISAEVVGFRENKVLLMPLEEIHDIHPGCHITASSQTVNIPIGPALVGRVIDGLGRPIDGKGPLLSDQTQGLYNKPPNPMSRAPIKTVFQTGIKAIDTFTPLGCGQRVGIFSGSGVGKSTLLGMIARGAESDINVIALIGERGRELREFIENDLGPEGMAKSILVVSTSDQAAPMRLRAAFLATRIAESFRDSSQKVLLLMDSITRFAMAQREIGLAIGEPPTSRGYTPSVFSHLPRLLERSGMNEHGSITALYTVLVEGDDLNEPISDAVRGILDGHIILSRELAAANHFPSIEVLDSISRLVRALLPEEKRQVISKARDLLTLYRKNEDLINIGAYAQGSSPQLDIAIEKQPQLMTFLRQDTQEKVSREESFEQLSAILS